MQESGWMGLEKAARYVDCNADVLRRWVRSGILAGPGVGKTGRHYKFKAEALDKFIQINGRAKCRK